MATALAQTIALLRDLVAFDTTSRNSNLGLIDYVEAYLQRHGVASTRIPSADGRKSSLLARIGSEAEGGIVLSGHTDVVPVDGQDWRTPPFALTEVDGNLFGRGSADMKGFIAAVLAMVPHFLAATLRVPLYLAFSYDEEVGCLGAPDLVRHLVAQAKKPALAIVGEPTMMEVITAHKGVYAFETTVTGLESHSSTPHRGVNAVQVGCRLVAELAAMAERQATSTQQDARFDPPHSTVHVGLIEGGTARNIIPKTCRFQWEIRPLPGEDPQALIGHFERFATGLARESDATVKTALLSRTQGMQLAQGEPMQLVMACAQANDTRAVSFGTEAGVFQAHGVPVVVCGPGSIDVAHKPNEYIAPAQLDKALAFLARLTQACGH